MPKKIPFRVIYCTGWEDDYPPKDLEVWERDRSPAATQIASSAVHVIGCHGFCAIDFLIPSPQVHSPFIKGWRSPRYARDRNNIIYILF